MLFKALANAVRRADLRRARLRPLTTKQLARSFPELDRCTVMMHCGVLERAGLVVAVRKGRERFNYLDATPIQAIHERWIGPHAAHAAALADAAQARARRRAREATSRAEPSPACLPRRRAR